MGYRWLALLAVLLVLVLASLGGWLLGGWGIVAGTVLGLWCVLAVPAGMMIWAMSLDDR